MYTYNIFGSADSRDLDVAVILPEGLNGTSLKSHELARLETQIAQKIQSERVEKYGSTLEVDVTCVLLNEERHIVWTSKGTPTKTNNVIFSTYDLHKQDYPCIIAGLVPRRLSDEFFQFAGAIQRSVSLAYFNSLPHKKELKYDERQVVKLRCVVIDLEKVRGGNADETPHKRCKALAFQVAITHALFARKVQIFTKSDVFREYPLLEPFFRDTFPFPESAFVELNTLLQATVEWVAENQMVLKIERHPELAESLSAEKV
jgi:hypothetical protein